MTHNVNAFGDCALTIGCKILVVNADNPRCGRIYTVVGVTKSTCYTEDNDAFYRYEVVVYKGELK